MRSCLPRRIDQVLPSLRQADAIGLEALTLRDLFQSWGLASDIYAERAEHGLGALSLHDLTANRNTSSLLIYHFSIGSALPYHLQRIAVPLALRYHNITPPHFFSHPQLEISRAYCTLGRQQQAVVAAQSQIFWPASQFNAEDFKHTHFAAHQILPLTHRYERLTTTPPRPVALEPVHTFNLLFVGRVVPNKGIHDLLFTLGQLKKRLPQVRLRLTCVGIYCDAYVQEILRPVAAHCGLNLSTPGGSSHRGDAHLTGEVSEKTLRTHYQTADLFLCLSDHEGFGAPLVEAMTHGLPVIAHGAGAVAETVGRGGLIINKHQAQRSIDTLAQVISDAELRRNLQRQAILRAHDFRLEKLSTQWHTALAAAAEVLSPPCSGHLAPPQSPRLNRAHHATAPA